MASIRSQKGSTSSLFEQRKGKPTSKDDRGRGRYSKLPIKDTTTRNSNFDDSMEKIELLQVPSSEGP